MPASTATPSLGAVGAPQLRVEAGGGHGMRKSKEIRGVGMREREKQRDKNKEIKRAKKIEINIKR